MTKRILAIAFLLAFGLSSYALHANPEGPFAAMLKSGSNMPGIARIECSIQTDAESLFFQGNDYVPNVIRVTVTVTNTGQEIVDSVSVSVGADTRFNIESPADKLTNPFRLAPGESGTAVFTLNVASARKLDGFDTLRAIATSPTGANSVCTKSVWVEHEYYPDFNVLCEKLGEEIRFEDSLNDYTPNPFETQVTAENFWDGASDSTVIEFLGAQGVALHPSDISAKLVGVLAPLGDTAVVRFFLTPVRRTDDATITLIFQVRGLGGYKRKLYIDTCKVDVFIPRAKQAVYGVTCDILTDSVRYKDHIFKPNPFTFTFNASNVGTAAGVEVRAVIILPPGIEFQDTVPEQEADIPLSGNLGTADPPVSFSWTLSPDSKRSKSGWEKIRVRVYDKFGNQAFCEDSVFIDSVRAPKFNVRCECPDTIYVDPNTGLYLGNPFDVFFTVDNDGTEYEDSVSATATIYSPDIIIEGEKATQWLHEETGRDTLPRGDTLSVKNSWRVKWPLRARDRGISGPITILFKVDGKYGESDTCSCTIFVPQVFPPDLTCEARIVHPDDSTDVDTLHYDPLTVYYTPNRVLFKACVTNVGKRLAENVWATLAVPTQFQLVAGYANPMQVSPPNLRPGETGCAVWELSPLLLTAHGELVEFIVRYTADNVPSIPACNDYVFVPAIPKTISLTIANDNVGKTGDILYVPVSIDDPAGKDIKSIDFHFEYNVKGDHVPMDPRIVEFLGVADEARFRSEMILPSGWGFSTGSSAPLDPGYNGRVILEADPNNPEPLSRAGILVYLKFRVLFGGDQIDENKYNFTGLLWPPTDNIDARVLINAGSIKPQTLIPGLIVVSDDCLYPLMASERYSPLLNRPNPFNPTTTIEYYLRNDGRVKLSVFDQLGRHVRTLFDGDEVAGRHSVVFDASGLPSGIYYCRMETPNHTQVRSMILAR